MSDDFTSDRYVNLPIDAVVSLSDTRNVVDTSLGKTFEVHDLMFSVSKRLPPSNAPSHQHDEIRHNWCVEGIEAKVLIPGQPWQSGKVRLTIEFCPDQPEPETDSDQAETDVAQESEVIDRHDENTIDSEPEPENPGSLLDDIRQTLLQSDIDKNNQ